MTRLVLEVLLLAHALLCNRRKTTVMRCVMPMESIQGACSTYTYIHDTILQSPQLRGRHVWGCILCGMVGLIGPLLYSKGAKGPKKKAVTAWWTRYVL